MCKDTVEVEDNNMLTVVTVLTQQQRSIEPSQVPRRAELKLTEDWKLLERHINQNYSAFISCRLATKKETKRMGKRVSFTVFVTL